MEILNNTIPEIIRTSKIPHRVKNQDDFSFGLYLGGLKATIISFIETELGRSPTSDEWDEIDNIFIDYQDKIADLIFKN